MSHTTCNVYGPETREGAAVYAFVSHESACEALRLLFHDAEKSVEVSRWPRSDERFPQLGECVSGRRDFRAARVGEALSCLGMSARPVDLLVPARSGRSSGNEVRFHAWGGAVPQGSFLLVTNDLLVSGPELAIIQLCSAQGKLDALLDAHVEAVRAEAEVAAADERADRPVIDHPLEWERIRRLVAATVIACEFAGTYRLGAGSMPTAYRAPRIMDAAGLARVAAGVGKSQGTLRARRVAELMLEGSASPMETVLALMLTLPVEFGGFGLENPLLNRAVDVSGFQGTISDRDVVIPDFLWHEQGVALEYDSEEFHALRGKGQLKRDVTRSNTLTALGYRVFRATSQTVRSLPGISLLARQIACALDVELPAATPLQELRRRKLYMLLMPKR